MMVISDAQGADITGISISYSKCNFSAKKDNLCFYNKKKKYL